MIETNGLHSAVLLSRAPMSECPLRSWVVPVVCDVTDKAKRQKNLVFGPDLLAEGAVIVGNARKQVPNIDQLAVAITWSSEVTVVFNDIQFSDFFCRALACSVSSIAQQKSAEPLFPYLEQCFHRR